MKGNENSISVDSFGVVYHLLNELLVSLMHTIKCAHRNDRIRDRM